MSLSWPSEKAVWIKNSHWVRVLKRKAQGTVERTTELHQQRVAIDTIVLILASRLESNFWDERDADTLMSTRSVRFPPFVFWKTTSISGGAGKWRSVKSFLNFVCLLESCQRQSAPLDSIYCNMRGKWEGETALSDGYRWESSFGDIEIHREHLHMLPFKPFLNHHYYCVEEQLNIALRKSRLDFWVDRLHQGLRIRTESN